MQVATQKPAPPPDVLIQLSMEEAQAYVNEGFTHLNNSLLPTAYELYLQIMRVAKLEPRDN